MTDKQALEKQAAKKYPILPLRDMVMLSRTEYAMLQRKAYIAGHGSLKKKLIEFYIWVLDNQEGAIVGLVDEEVVKDVVKLYLSKKNIEW
jgi:hypothetical protein